MQFLIVLIKISFIPSKKKQKNLFPKNMKTEKKYLIDQDMINNNRDVLQSYRSDNIFALIFIL